MTLHHFNRIRRNNGGQVVREMLDIEAIEAAKAEPSDAEIRMRAFEIYLSRNGAPGNAEVDWLQAECELRASTLTAPQINDAD
ncbi:MAG: DUF2934 domain-containing protein [Phycisphaerae bacterium]|nr:DUF2934 domain-containing protein [Phycisphaerae bacterium]